MLLVLSCEPLYTANTDLALPPGRLISVHRLTSVPGRGLIAVRPDGYIGFRCRVTEARQLAAWLTRLAAQ